MSRQPTSKKTAGLDRRQKASKMAAVRRFANEVVELFSPDKIILFGSYAYGRPHADSDVDILVIMPTKGEITQAYRIRLATRHPFAMDLLVRTPETIERRMAEEDWFIEEIVTKGKVLYEKGNGRVGPKSRGRRGGIAYCLVPT